MKISELPEEIRDLVKKRTKELEGDKKAVHLISAFNWSESCEGLVFWNCLNKGNFNPYYAKYGLREGSYYVCEEYETSDNEYNPDRCGKVGYVYKQRETSKYLRPAVDLERSTINGHNIIVFDCSAYLTKWRYATQEEIDHYEKIGEPFHYSEVGKVSNLVDYEIVYDAYYFCKNEEEAEWIINLMYDKGYRWVIKNTGDRTKWNSHSSFTPDFRYYKIVNNMHIVHTQNPSIKYEVIDVSELITKYKNNVKSKNSTTVDASDERRIRKSSSRTSIRGCRSSFEKSYRRQGKGIERSSKRRGR